jgi:hypothetical protein
MKKSEINKFCQAISILYSEGYTTKKCTLFHSKNFGYKALIPYCLNFERDIQVFYKTPEECLVTEYKIALEYLKKEKSNTESVVSTYESLTNEILIINDLIEEASKIIGPLGVLL